MKVKATKEGFIFGLYMKKGDEFTLTSKTQFSSNWMEEIKSEAKPRKKSVKKDEE